MSTYITQAAFTEKHGNFKISEYCIEGKPPTKKIAGFILKDHIEPMNKVRDEYDGPILVSKRSGYRPRAYEVSKKRSGNGQHNFEDTHPKGTGAADYTCAVAKELIPLVLKHTCYNRICYYPNNNFVHCDYKPTPSGKRELYTSQSPTSKWKLDRVIEG
jgi:hypothetical protein